MVFLCWGRPSPQDQKACIHKAGTFNYDDKYKGATAKSLSSLEGDIELSKGGFVLNNARVLLGSGVDTFEKGKSALKSWRHFGLNWAFVDPKTPVQQGVKFCVSVKEFLPWLMMPLQVVYINETRPAKNRGAAFSFGSGTLHGHLLVIVIALANLLLTVDPDSSVTIATNLVTLLIVVMLYIVNHLELSMLCNLLPRLLLLNLSLQPTRPCLCSMTSFVSMRIVKPLVLLLLLRTLDQNSGQMIGSGCESHGLYHLQPITHVGSAVESPLLVHARLGHPSLQKLQHLVPNLSQLSTLPCESCQLGKHIRRGGALFS